MAKELFVAFLNLASRGQCIEIGLFFLAAVVASPTLPVLALPDKLSESMLEVKKLTERTHKHTSRLRLAAAHWRHLFEGTRSKSEMTNRLDCIHFDALWRSSMVIVFTAVTSATIVGLPQIRFNFRVVNQFVLCGRRDYAPFVTSCFPCLSLAQARVRASHCRVSHCCASESLEKADRVPNLADMALRGVLRVEGWAEAERRRDVDRVKLRLVGNQ